MGYPLTSVRSGGVYDRSVAEVTAGRQYLGVQKGVIDGL
jgi:hypothetical protein